MMVELSSEARQVGIVKGNRRSTPAVARSRMFRFSPIVWLVTAFAMVAVILFGLQIVTLVVTSITPNEVGAVSTLTADNFEYIFSSNLLVPVIINSLVLAAGSVVVMLWFATPFAWLYARTNLPYRSALIAILTTKVAIPGFLVAMGYIFMMNPSNGLFNQWAKSVFDLSSSPLNVYHMGWIIFLQGLSLSAPCFFMLAPSFMAIDSSLEEAARVSGLSEIRTFLRVTLPLLTPAIVAVTIYYFIIGMETFDYPAVLGIPTRTYTISTWLYRLISQSNDLPLYGQAAALGVLVSVFASGLSFIYFWVTRYAERYAVVSGKRRVHVVTKLSRRGLILAWTFIAVFTLFGLILPVLSLVWASLLPFLQPPSWAAFQSLTLDAYRRAAPALSQALLNSLIVMVTAPTISVAFALAIAWVSARGKFRGRKIVDVLALVTVGIPSVVSALAFLYAGFWTYRFVPLFGTIWLVVIALGTLRSTWAKQSIGNAMLQIHKELEEAGSVSGVGRGRILLSIVIPILKPAIVFSWFWIALLTLRELTIPVMLFDSGNALMPTSIWLLNISGRTAVASAMGVCLIAVIGVVVITFHRIVGSRSI